MFLKRALFCDRDGILNEVVPRNGIPTAPRDWKEVKECPELSRLGEIKNLGLLLVLVTNQPDIERGTISEVFAEELHDHYKKKYGFDAIYMCPFSDDKNPLKKPNPGMFLQAAKTFDITLSSSYHLGDTDRDVGAAAKAGCKSILWDRPYNQGLATDYRVKDFDQLWALLSQPSIA